jgi:hypothetical protein
MDLFPARIVQRWIGPRLIVTQVKLPVSLQRNRTCAGVAYFEWLRYSRVARERAVKTRNRMAIFSVLLLIFAKPLMDWAVVRT